MYKRATMNALPQQHCALINGSAVLGPTRTLVDIRGGGIDLP
jgi:hypothetical protein